MGLLYEDLIPLLETNAIGTLGEDLYWGEHPIDAAVPEPYDPDWEPPTYVALYESPGPAGLYAKDGPAGTEGRLQVLVGAYRYQDAMQKALDVYALLDDLRETLFGTSYHFRALQRPFDVGAQDEAGRTVISTNYAVFIRSI